jgi:hypothetical protein
MKVRAIQKVIIVIYLAVITTACLYVPWTAIYNSYYPVSLMYSFIWKPLLKITEVEAIFVGMGVVDIKRVILELIAITAVFGIFFVLTLRPKKVIPGP